MIANECQVSIRSREPGGRRILDRAPSAYISDPSAKPVGDCENDGSDIEETIRHRDLAIVCDK
jgi:hypothetical protein